MIMAQPAAKVFTTAHDQPVADTHLAICASIAQLQASAQKMFEGLSICLDAQEGACRVTIFQQPLLLLSEVNG